MIKRAAILLLFISVGISAVGHNIRHYDVSSGLSENTIKGITQDAYGYMWFGTQDGLNVFNGREFLSFGCSYHEMAGHEKGSLNILSVLKHSDGRRIWLVCRNAVTLFDPADRSYKDIVFPNKIAPVCAAYARDGSLWIGTEKGLFTYSEAEDTLEKIPLKGDESERDGIINAIYRDSRNRVWVCGEEGFFRYIPVTERFEQISDKNTLSVLEDSSGAIWVGLWYEGLARYNAEVNRIDVLPHIREDMAVLRVRAMVEDTPGIILLCTNRGRFRFSKDTGKLRKIILTAERSTDNVYSCFKDREGGIWVGTYFKGLYYLLPQDGTIEAYTPGNTPECFHGSAVSSFCEDERGRIWTGAENGGLSLFLPAEGTFRCLSFPNPANNIHALCMDADHLYVGTFAQGMMRVDLTRETIKEFRNGGPGSIPDNHVFSLLRLRDGRILVGTRRGCGVFNPRTEKCTTIPQLSDAFIYAICEDASGTLWLADYYNGLHRLEGLGGAYRHYEHQADNPSSLPCDRLVNVQNDDKGNLWISSDGGGLCRYDSASDAFIPFTIREGKQPKRISVIYGCLNDRKGNLWISSNDGIWCCDAEGNGKHYTGFDGLQSNQFNYGAAFRSSKGELYFGGINGFNVIDPDAVPAAIPPSPLVTTVSWTQENGEVFSSPLITDKAELTVPRDISHFHVHFECLSYLAPENIRYEYRIDDEKIAYTTEGAVTFADFPYGKHEITVSAISSRGTVSSHTVHIFINNAPPYHLSRGAIFLYVILLAGLVFGIIKWVEKRKQEMAERDAYEAKLTFFTQIAHEIKTPVTLIRGPLDILLRERHSDREDNYLSLIRKNVNRLQELIGQLLDFKKISSGGYELHLKTINPGQTLSDVVEQFNGARQGTFDLHLSISEDIGSCRMDPEAFTKIASNLLSNAVKHTHDSISVNLSLTARNGHDYLHLSVKDNGKGIPQKYASRVFESFYQVRTERTQRQPGIGLGLSLVKLLAEKHNGRAYVDTKYTEGCCVCVDIPYIPAQAPSVSTVPNLRKAASRIQVLVVEDNTELLEFLRTCLQEDYIVLEALNGKEALELLREKDIDLVVSDIYMPECDGFTLLQEVRNDGMLCHIPVILLTAESSLDTKIKGLEYGANAYIEKPFSIEQLVATINNIIKDRETVRKAFRFGSALPVRTDSSSQDNKFLETISDIILDRMGDSWISVEELAESLNVSHSSLQRKIKGLTGLSPVEFIRNVKIKKAAEMLASGDYRVNEVCYAVGFSKPSYFSACFKKQFGVLPKDYIKGK